MENGNRFQGEQTPLQTSERKSRVVLALKNFRRSVGFKVAVGSIIALGVIASIPGLRALLSNSGSNISPVNSDANSTHTQSQGNSVSINTAGQYCTFGNIRISESDPSDPKTIWVNATPDRYRDQYRNLNTLVGDDNPLVNHSEMVFQLTPADTGKPVDVYGNPGGEGEGAYVNLVESYQYGQVPVTCLPAAVSKDQSNNAVQSEPDALPDGTQLKPTLFLAS